MLRIFMLTSIISIIKVGYLKTKKSRKQSFVWLTLVTRTGIENLGTLFVTFRDMQKSPIIRHFRTIYKNAFTLFFAKFLHP